MAGSCFFWLRGASKRRGVSQAAAPPPLQRPRPSRGHAALQQDVTLFTPPPSGDRFLNIEFASRLKSSIGETGRLLGVRQRLSGVNWSGQNRSFRSPAELSCVPEMDAGTLASDNLLPHKRLASVSCERLKTSNNIGPLRSSVYLL